MFSLLVGLSRTPAPHLPHTGYVSKVSEVPSEPLMIRSAFRVSNDPKKEVDATIDFLYTVIKGHWLACACEILSISTLDGPIALSEGLLKAGQKKQQLFVEGLAQSG